MPSFARFDPAIAPPETRLGHSSPEASASAKGACRGAPSPVALPLQACDDAAADDALAGAHALQLADEAVHLLPDRALWHPGTSTVFVADLHLGKAATFRARGLPVPAGTTQDNLERLSHLIERHQAQRLVVLGDFMHAAESHTPSVLAALAQWRERHAAVEMVLVRGNHDSHAGDPPASLDIAVVDEPYAVGPFACCHHPQRHDRLHVLAGHVHPAVQLRGGGARDALRLPCFSLEAGLTVLPAFGAFTGAFSLQHDAARTLYPVGAGRVWCMPVSDA